MYRIWERNNKWYWNLRCEGNHRVLLTCPKGHPVYRSAFEELRQVWKWAKGKYKPMNSLRYCEVMRQPSGETRHYFILRNRDGLTLCKSRNYKHRDSMIRGANVAARYGKCNDTLVVSP